MGDVMGDVMYQGWDREITIIAGNGEDRRQFRGRRDLLVEHSGYFRSLLDSSSNEEIAVPSVCPEVFSRILKFVNTGLLDLTPDNIYSVLLATHLLHMPRALELCRNYLVLERHRLLRTPPPPSIVKPIPSRKYFFWPPPFFTLPPPPPPHYASLYVPNLPVPQTHFDHDTSHLPSTSVFRPVDPVKPPKQPTVSRESVVATPEKPDKNVYKDIACCDGPVRFKRVLNVNYGTPQSNVEPNRSKNDDDTRRRIFICSFCKHTFKSHYCFRKHTRRHLNPVSLNPMRTPEKETKDMNVQYYPCKTCGSKFPSYYFVHKHRKMCHGTENCDEMKIPSTDNTCDNTTGDKVRND